MSPLVAERHDLYAITRRVIEGLELVQRKLAAVRVGAEVMIDKLRDDEQERHTHAQ